MNLKRSFEYFDPQQEELFDLRRGHAEIPRAGRTLYLYATNGVTVNGQTFKLRVCRAPHTISCSLEEWRRFLSRVNAAAAEESQ